MLWNVLRVTPDVCAHLIFHTDYGISRDPERVMEELGKPGSSNSSPQHPASHTVLLLVPETCKYHILTESFPNWKQNSQSLCEHTVKSKPNKRLHCLKIYKTQDNTEINQKNKILYDLTYMTNQNKQTNRKTDQICGYQSGKCREVALEESGQKIKLAVITKC